MLASQAAYQILVLFFLMAAGYAAGKLGYLDEAANRGISKFLVNFIIPALVIESMQRPFSPELRNEAYATLAISAGVYVLSFPLAYLFVGLIRARGVERGAEAFGAVFSNVAFMGFPVVEALLGRDALFALSVYNIPFQLLAFSVGPYMLAKSSGTEAKLSLSSFVSPACLSAVLGFALFSFGILLPEPVRRPIRLLGDMTTPLSMALIGSILSRSSAKALSRNPRLFATAAYRLLGFPLLLFAALRLAGLGGRLLALPVIVAAMPAAANSAILAKAYGGDAETASSLVLVSTLASAATIPLLVVILGF
jgi:predicted permease